MRSPCYAIVVRQGSLLGWFDIQRSAAMNCDVEPIASRDVRPSGTETGALLTSRPYLASSCGTDYFGMETHMVSTRTVCQFPVVNKM